MTKRFCIFYLRDGSFEHPGIKSLISDYFVMKKYTRLYVIRRLQSKEGGKDCSARLSAKIQNGNIPADELTSRL